VRRSRPPPSLPSWQVSWFPFTPSPSVATTPMVTLHPSSALLSNPKANLTRRGSPSLIKPRPRLPPSRVPAIQFAQIPRRSPQTTEGISHPAIPKAKTGGGESYRLGLFTGRLYASYVAFIPFIHDPCTHRNQCRDTSGPTPVDDLATTPTPSPTNETDLLPPGWSRTSEKSAFRTTVILSLSLVLAAVIVVFIIVIRLWRRKRKEELRKDVERKLVRRRGPSQSIESERESRTKSKLWARATTRWRENVRQSARRRRNARLSTTSPYAPNNSTTSFSQTVASTTSSPQSRPSSLPPSRISSPEPAVSIARSVLSSPSRTDHEPHTDIEPPSPSPPPAPPLPPAYQGRSLSISNISTKDLARLSPGSLPYDAHITHIDSPCPNSPPPSPLENDTTPPNSHVAHVATDDKAVLRQMEVLSSQPPTEPGSSCDVHGSAPDLYEDDVETLEYEDGSELVPSHGFPLPPTSLPSSKGKAAALEYYDYDDLNVEPDLLPSAPPFEAKNPIVPSAPPQGEAQPHPSAPPEIADPGDDPTAPTHDCPPRQMCEPSVDPVGPGSSSVEPPQYRP